METAAAPHPAEHLGAMSTSLPPETLDDRVLPGHWPEMAGYRIDGLLGSGGFGTVLAATRVADDFAVAIKIAGRDDAIACERLLVEAAALRAIGPPCVPALYEVGRDSRGTPYFAFERLAIPTLDTLLGQPMARAEFLAIAQAIVAALASAHARGYIHCDIKPQNIFVDPAGKAAKLIDFGLARPAARATAPGAAFESMPGMVMGTPLYMAPEQGMGTARIDVRTDVYSVGVVLYEMLTGTTPFCGEPADVRTAHASQRPLPPSHRAAVSPGVDAVVLRCLAKEPEQRFATMDELLRALCAAVDSASAAGSAPSSLPPGPARSPAPRAGATAAPSALVGLLFFESAAETGAVKDAVIALGGRILSVIGRRCIAAVGMDSGGDPMDRALDAARALMEQGIAERVLVDRERVRVVQGRGGTPRILATGLHRADQRFPRPEDPRGILVSATTAGALSGARTSTVPGHAGRLQLLGPDPRAPAAEHGPPLGRERVFVDLLGRARAALERGVPALATVLGDSGYGKSHLAAAMVTELRTWPDRVRVLVMRAREPVGGDKDRTLRRLLMATLGAPASAPEDGGRAFAIARLGERVGEQVWPAVAMVLGWLPPDAPEVRRLSAAPTALRAAAARAAGEALRVLAAEEPVCFVLDDVQFADEVTLDALEYATLGEAGVPLWVCVLGWPSFASARPLWGNRAAGAHTVMLGPLAQRSAEALCRRLLRPAQNIPAKTVARLIQQTRGSPLLLTEIARAVKRHGLIRRHRRGDGWFLATDELEKLPDLPRVEWLAERELAALPPDLAAHARLLALLGAEFTTAEVEGVLRELERDGLGEVFPLDAWVAARRLRDRGLLVAHDRDRLEFRNALIRDRIARLTPEGLRRQIHQAAHRYYRDAGSMTEHRRLPLVAHHAAYAGAVEIAAPLYLELADRAQSRHDYLDAEIMYGRALELMPEHDERRRMDALRGRGLMRYRLSRFEDALADLRASCSIAEQLTDPCRVAEILLDEATVLDWMRDFLASQDLVERAAELSPSASPLLGARLSLGRGRALFRTGESERAQALLHEAAVQAQAVGDDGYETQVIALMLLGYMLGNEGDVARANQVFETCMALCTERGDRLHLAAVLSNRRELWIAQNNVERAVIDGLRSQRIGREIGQIGVEYVTSYNLAELYYYAGEGEAASPHIRRAVEIEPSCAPKPLARLLEARLLVLAGDFKAAGAAIAHIHAAQARSHEQGDANALFAESDAVLLAMVELSVAGAGAALWERLRARAKVVSPRLEYIEVLEMMGLCMLRAGDDTRAATLWREALALCREKSHPLEERVRAHLAAAG
jgi:eukaryotic-like serine/threonine-protein kinase